MSGLWKKLSEKNRYSHHIALVLVAFFFALVMGPFLMKEEDKYLLQFLMLVFFVVAVTFLALGLTGRDEELSEKISKLIEASPDQLGEELAGIPDTKMVFMYEIMAKKRRRPPAMETIAGELHSRGLITAETAGGGRSLYSMSELSSDPRNTGLELNLSEKFILKRYDGIGYKNDEEDEEEIIWLKDLKSVTVIHSRDASTMFKEDMIEMLYEAGNEEKKLFFAPFYLDQWIAGLRVAGLDVVDKRKLRG